MTIETILEYLNAVPVRATYGAVGEVLGVRPQVVPRLLGARRPEASWIVNGGTGDPTGYTPDEVDPRLAGTHVIRSGDELRRCLERHAAAAPDAVSTTDAGGVQETPETAGGVQETRETAVAVQETPETEAVAMGSETKWIIGTVVPAVLLVAALLSAQIASMSGSLNTRIDDVNDRIDDLRADLTAQIAGVNTRIDDVREALEEEIAVLRTDVGSVAARLRAVELALGLTDPDLAPAPEAGEQTVESDPDAPAASLDPQPEPATSPAEPAASPDPQPEPATSPAEPAVSPDSQPEPATSPAEPVVNPDPPRE